MKQTANILLFLLMLSTLSFADEYVIISNTHIKKLSTSQIKAIFLKKISVIDNINIVPINLGTSSKLRKKFENKILNMSFSRLKSYWTKHHYLGQRPPISMKSQEGVKAFVKKVEGAVGYINAKNLDDGVKVLYRWRE